MNRNSAPIFIMGNHRSGTTWLHKLIVETCAFDYLCAYHIVYYNSLSANTLDIKTTPGYQELSKKFEQLEINQRIFDEVEIAPDTPEEYNFILSNAGTGGRITQKNLHIFQEMCSKIAITKPLILKNPWDYSNFLYIKKAIPESRFLFIHRHPERVLHSLMKMSSSLLESKHLYMSLLSKDYRNLYDYKIFLNIARFLMFKKSNLACRLANKIAGDANQYYVDNIGKLNKDDYLSIRYEDLCERPKEFLEKILNFANVDPALAALPVTGSRPRPAKVLPEIENHRSLIARKMAPYMELHGYRAGES
jgi:hypothetical protein